MSRESDLLFGLLALQMNFVSREQLLECAAIWMGNSSSRLSELFRARGFVKPSQDAALQMIVEEQLKANGRDAQKTLGGLPVDRQIRDALARLPAAPGMAQPLSALKTREDPETIIVTPAPSARYLPGAEIGRGGLGCVVEGRDTVLQRDVAMKVVLDGLPAQVAERFAREAKLTAGLEHPAIIPVYDFGAMDGTRLFLVMRRVRGRDFGKVLRSAASAERAYSRARLLRMLQDVCLGMAFAHDRGVIHRDLKPANIMIGDYGEVLIVDWGLAKVLTEAETPAAGGGAGHDSGLTMNGEVVGTPTYMPPEQAEGRLHDLDRRTDIYALGAILYEILAQRPPFEGKTAHEVISKVRSGRITPPSRVVAGEGDSERTVLREPSAHAAIEPIPPELDAICMKALAFRREDRYGTARELHDDIQLFLEGVRQRERNHRLAEEAVGRAKEAMEQQKRLEREAHEINERRKQLRRGGNAAASTKEALKARPDTSSVWALEDHATRLELEAVEAFNQANALLSSALTYEARHAEARRLRAELYWKRFLAAESRGDEKEMRVHRAEVERYNDGPLDAQLKGDGTLSVRTRAYDCRCLVDGRPTRGEDLVMDGYHLSSGRSLSGRKEAEGLPELEPTGPLHLKVHGPRCSPEALDGADVWLFRYDEIGRRLFPVTPTWGDSTRPIPSTVIDGCFEASSPYRPQGPGVWLGRTPIEGHVLPMGSYLLLVSHERRAPLRVPIVITRCGSWQQDVTLFHPEEIPPGMIAISAGPFGFQGDPIDQDKDSATTPFVDDVFIARHPVTCGEFCVFLNDLARTRPAEAARRVPRSAENAGRYWPGPPYAVPTASWLAQAPAEEKNSAHRLLNCSLDWEEDWPVVSVSWEDLIAYCAWRSAREGRIFTPPHEVVWEKSARGTDRRVFPFGNDLDESWANITLGSANRSGPVRVCEFPDDESPYGVRGLVGNIRDFCLNALETTHPGTRVSRGGYWLQGSIYSRAASRTAFPTRFVTWADGGRVMVPCRLSGLPSTGSGGRDAAG